MMIPTKLIIQTACSASNPSYSVHNNGNRILERQDPRGSRHGATTAGPVNSRSLLRTFLKSVARTVPSSETLTSCRFPVLPSTTASAPARGPGAAADTGDLSSPAAASAPARRWEESTARRPRAGSARSMAQRRGGIELVGGRREQQHAEQRQRPEGRKSRSGCCLDALASRNSMSLLVYWRGSESCEGETRASGLIVIQLSFHVTRGLALDSNFGFPRVGLKLEFVMFGFINCQYSRYKLLPLSQNIESILNYKMPRLIFKKLCKIFTISFVVACLIINVFQNGLNFTIFI